MPGEYLWRKLQKSEENDDFAFLAAAMVPLLVGLGAITLARPLIRISPLTAVGIVVFSLCVAFWISAKGVAKRIYDRDDYYLGFFGERFVAECLEPLKAKGWHVFHDIPCEGNSGPFNIDHAAVGSNGVWVIETKCVRKRENTSDHEVVYDGSQLIWPWKTDTNGLSQAAANAEWLKKWFEKQTGKHVNVHAVVTFPGWEVIERRLTTVRVANPKNLPAVLTGRPQAALHSDEIDLFRRLLSERCRDITY